MKRNSNCYVSFRELVAGENKEITAMNSPGRCQNEMSSFDRITALKC